MHVIAVSAAEELAHRQSRDLSEDIPACDVDTTFHIRMPFERGVHRTVELRELARILADEVRSELAQAGAHALGVRGKVERTKGADFSVTGTPVVGFDADDRAIEDLNRFAATPCVRGFVE